MPDPTLNERDEKAEAPLCRTLADRIFEENRKPEQIILFANPATVTARDEVSKHYEHMPDLKGGKVIDGQILIIDDINPDFGKRLEELVARQTRLFNSDATVQERILIHNEIETIQKKKREAGR
jgi:hypothetical protein